MELMPRQFIAGLFTPVPLPKGNLTRMQINQIWADVTSKYDDFVQLQIAQDAASAQFVGPTDQTSIVIQPPLLQVRDDVRLTPAKSAERAEDVFKTISHWLGATQVFNLGVKLQYHAPAPDNNAPDFMLHRVLSKTADDVEEFTTAGQLAAGVRYYVQQPDRMFVITIEPLLVDPKLVFLDLDAQFPGPLSLDAVESRCAEANDFVQGPVSRYLDKHATP